MISRARKLLLTGVIGATSLIAASSALSFSVAASGLDDDSDIPSAVETFEYPDSAKILKERGIALHKGDGHILLTDCSASRDIIVMSTRTDEPNPDRGRYCFKVTGTGKTGYLALEIPKVFRISTGDYAVRAMVNADGKTTEVRLGKQDGEGVGQGTNPPGSPAVLVELRVTS
ncbi:hypothetical protein Q3V23_27740 [Streptomyces sp. VNUA116]|uniref:hypothetical protein n=1 Tax=Streptomyces sp. VNUA116 TaxID=3062449 RepID=UPI0026773D4C|nr:hypothetical protein [Streptomyces sp. VNUA116]WKU47547.1 hypothetical protein Q3V23_27740 [Streptomyces sp. VNUA116]